MMAKYLPCSSWPHAQANYGAGETEKVKFPFGRTEVNALS